MTGAEAGAANFPREFRMPDWKETIDTRSRKGKVMRESVIARSIIPPFSAKPGARIRTTQGMKISIRITKNARKKARTEMALAENSIDFSFPSLTSFCETMGTNADVKAPSAKRLRKQFGSLNATKKASDMAPAPRKLARIMSRKNPVMRLSSVKLPKVAIDLNKDMLFPSICINL